MDKLYKSLMIGFALLVVSIVFNLYQKPLTEGILLNLIMDAPMIFISGEVAVVYGLIQVINWKKFIPSLSRLNFDAKKILLILVCFAFTIRVSLQFLYPCYCGWDTAVYVANTLYYSRHSIPECIMELGTVVPVNFPGTPLPDWIYLPIPSEPLFYVFTVSLYRLGMPIIDIVLIIVPLISAALLIPFFYIARELSSEKAALLAVAFLVVSPWQFRLMLDLYASLFAYLFFLCAIYFFIFYEKDKRIPFISIIFATCMFLSSFFVSLFFGFTILGYLLLKREKQLFYRICILAVSVIVLTSLFTKSNYPYTVYYRYVVIGLSVYQYLANFLKSIMLYKANPLDAYIRDIVRVFFPMLPLFVPILLGRKRVKIPKISQAFVFGVCCLCSVFIALSFFSSFEALDRSLMFLEVPLIIAASSVLIDDRPFYVTMLLWSCLFCVHHISFWYGGATVWWAYFKTMLGGEVMPDNVHATNVFGWVASSGIFTGVAVSIYHVLERWKKI